MLTETKRMDKPCICAPRYICTVSKNQRGGGFKTSPPPKKRWQKEDATVWRNAASNARTQAKTPFGELCALVHLNKHGARETALHSRSQPARRA